MTPRSDSWESKFRSLQLRVLIDFVTKKTCPLLPSSGHYISDSTSNHEGHGWLHSFTCSETQPARRCLLPTPNCSSSFAVGRDEEAFAELVRRHGPVVYRVCRRLVGSAAADDAFQASFLVLATRLPAARAAGSVGGWLVGVAGRVARQMRRAAGRRMRHEAVAVTHRKDVLPDQSLDLADQFCVLDEELARLPDQLRDPIVLCLLQGRTQEQAAVELGRDARTLRRRLERAKQVLRASPGAARCDPCGGGRVGDRSSDRYPRLFRTILNTRTVAMVFDFLTGGRAMSRSAPVVLANGVATNMIARKAMHLMAAVAAGLVGLGVVVAGDDPRPAGLKEGDARNVISIVQAAPKAGASERQILIQALCVQVPSGFCKECGLAEEDGPSVGAWVLTPREARMFQALVRGAMEAKKKIDILSRPQIQVIENQTGFIQVGQEVPYTTLEAEKKYGKMIYNRKIESFRRGRVTQSDPAYQPGRQDFSCESRPDAFTVKPDTSISATATTAPVFNFRLPQMTVQASDGETTVVSSGRIRATRRHEVLWVLTPHIVRGDENVVVSLTIQPKTRLCADAADTSSDQSRGGSGEECYPGGCAAGAFACAAVMGTARFMCRLVRLRSTSAVTTATSPAPNTPHSSRRIPSSNGRGL